LHLNTVATVIGMSALAPKADICSALTYVCFGPEADILENKQKDRFSAVSPNLD